MKACKTYVLSFLMGGFYCAIGQLFLMLWVSVLGPASPYNMAATLLSMGVVGVVLFVAGIHQKLAEKTGWGSILVFNGFACALADTYEGAAAEGGAGKGVLALLDLFLWVVGTGALLAIMGALGAFAGAGTGILVIGFGEAVYMAVQGLLQGDWTGILTNLVVLVVFCCMGVVAGAGHLARTKGKKASPQQAPEGEAATE